MGIVTSLTMLANTERDLVTSWDIGYLACLASVTGWFWG